MKILKVLLKFILGILLLFVFITIVMFVRQSFIKNKINNDYSEIINNESCKEPVSIENVSFIEQDISCGYAIIEMLSNWQNKNITEQSLYEENNQTISTAIGKGFLNEMEKQFSEWNTTRYVNLSNIEILEKMYNSLQSGMPVPIEFAALRNTDSGDVWTLHFGLVTGMDLSNDVITVQNPYGYEEKYSVDDFLCATRYDSYENMEIFFRFGFAFEMFHMNTIYIIQN